MQLSPLEMSIPQLISSSPVLRSHVDRWPCTKIAFCYQTALKRQFLDPSVKLDAYATRLRYKEKHKYRKQFHIDVKELNRILKDSNTTLKQVKAINPVHAGVFSSNVAVSKKPKEQKPQVKIDEVGKKTLQEQKPQVKIEEIGQKTLQEQLDDLRRENRELKAKVDSIEKAPRYTYPEAPHHRCEPSYDMTRVQFPSNDGKP